MTVSAFVRGTRRWSWHCALANEFSQSRAMPRFLVTEGSNGEKVSKKLRGSEVFPPGEKVWRGQVSFSGPWEILRSEGCSRGVRHAMYGCTVELEHEWSFSLNPWKCAKRYSGASLGHAEKETHLMVDPSKRPVILPKALGGWAGSRRARARPGWAQVFPRVQASGLNLNYGWAPARMMVGKALWDLGLQPVLTVLCAPQLSCPPLWEATVPGPNLCLCVGAKARCGNTILHQQVFIPAYMKDSCALRVSKLYSSSGL